MIEIQSPQERSLRLPSNKRSVFEALFSEFVGKPIFNFQSPIEFSLDSLPL